MAQMERISPEQVRHIGLLSRLKLSDQEVALFSEQLSSIVGYFQHLNELDTSTVQPTAHALPIQNVFRADEPGLTTQPLGPDRVLANAPQREGNFFRVPKVLEQDSA
jgi:aspartyl-tRNA(Asn)/glutamyl-tRNA(Gln) amidotransferase subunit C